MTPLAPSLSLSGALGRKALEGGVQLPRSVIVMGILATVAAILLVGRIASQVLASMDLEGSITQTP